MIVPISFGFIIIMLILGVGLGKIIIDAVGPVLIVVGVILGIILIKKILDWISDLM